MMWPGLARRAAGGDRGPGEAPRAPDLGSRRQGVRLGAPVQQGGHQAVRRPAAAGGPILAIRTADLAEKEAILAAGAGAFFTIPHFDGYHAYLVQLDQVSAEALREALVDGWLAIAPRPLADRYLAR